MVIRRNIELSGEHGKPVLADIYYQNNGEAKPIVIFAHGFKGFKDWGTFDLVGRRFAQAGFVFIKFNFSHNGTTPENTLDFVDLEAFGHNNFSIEMDDLGTVIDWLYTAEFPVSKSEIDLNHINLIGHSRGGGIAVLKATEDDRIEKLATWAAVSVFGRYWSSERMQKWKENGVMFVKNGRTGQEMPMYYQMYEDLYANADKLNIPSAAKKLKIPYLIVHGTSDEAVPIQHALDLNEWSGNSKVLKIEKGAHTFGGTHPWLESHMPADLTTVVKETIDFFNE